MNNFIKNGNWGLKLLALALAIVIYQTLKTETSRRSHNDNDRSFFKSR